MLQDVLRHNADILESTLVERGFMNYSAGTFIRQVLRGRGGQPVQARVRVAKADIDEILERFPSRVSGDPVFNDQHSTELQIASCRASSMELSSRAIVDSPAEASFDRLTVMEQFAAALYRCLLLREPDLRGLADAVNNLCSGHLDFESALKSCLGCLEFKSNLNEFIRRYAEPQPFGDRDTLTALASRYGSDKGTVHGVPPHKYTYLYDLIFSKYRLSRINLLEIGLCRGGPEAGGPVERSVNSPSLEMWLQFFPNAHIYGFDISDFSHLQNPRFTFVRGDAGSIEDLQRLAEQAAGYDIVIDDASHASLHQQLAFRYLFPKLRAGGTYIIEDVHWQPQVYERDAGNLPKTAEFMISYFEKQSYLTNEVLSEDFMAQVQESLDAFAWFPAFDGTASKPKLIVLTKPY